MNLSQLRYLVALDKYRHFARAAEDCKVTQPTLSSMIQKLEEELNTKLFDRNVQPIVPTAIGEIVIQQAKKALKEADLIIPIVEDASGSLKGELYIGILPTIAPYLLPLVLKKLIKENSSINLKIRELKTSDCLKGLKNNEIDIAIIADVLNNHSYKSEILYYEEFFAYLSVHEPLYKEKSIKSSEIDGRRLWLLDEGHCFRDQLIRFCELKFVKEQSINYTSGSMEAFMRLVEGGNGMTFIPELCTRQLSEEQYKHVRSFAIPRPTRAITAVTRQDFIKHNMYEYITKIIRNSVPSEMLELQPGQQHAK